MFPLADTALSGRYTEHPRAQPLGGAGRLTTEDFCMLNGGSVEPISLRNQVADLIKGAMLSGKLKPGERIVELRLAKELGLGTTSIREALFQLERQGYVTRVLNKGAYVTELSPEDRRQIYTVRMELEGLSAQLAAERRENLSLEPL